MALMRDLSMAQHAFEVQGHPVDQFLCVRFRGQEGFCQLYRFEVDLVATDVKFDPDTVVGKPATLSVNTANGMRYFHGLVSRFEMTGENSKYGDKSGDLDQVYFRAELVPAVWTLTHRYTSRIFQNKTVPEIITAVLEKAGLSGDRVKIGPFQGTHTAREYCVQYRETDYTFICRLMEEEGIWWYFEQSKDKHVFVAADSTSGYKPLPGDGQKLPYVPPTGLNTETEHVFRFRRNHALRPGKVSLTDFNFENPKLDLKASGDGKRDPSLEIFDYPGEYAAQAAGTELAKLRAQEFDTGRVLAIGQSNSSRLAPALTFELAGHPMTSMNGKYVITSVHHQGKQAPTRTAGVSDSRNSLIDAGVFQSLRAARSSDNALIRDLAEALLQIASRLKRGDLSAHRALSTWVYHAGQVSRDLATVAGALGSSPAAALSVTGLLEDPGSVTVEEPEVEYECRFECIPSDVTFRPPRLTPWPVMRGTQTARVVGPSGEEIYTDKYGRVKVQFNWDREGKFDDKSSCWIRVNQHMAGGQYGMLFLPRVGQEVIVDFLEGNPDCPLIVGSVYNADQMPPYALPDHKTRSVIKTHSSKGGGGTNEIRFEDLKDSEQLLIQAQRQMDLNVKASHHHTVGGSYHLKVGGEKDGQLSGEVRELIFKARQTHIKGDQKVKIEKTDGLEVVKDQTIKVGGARGVTVGGDHLMKATGDYKAEATGKIHLKGSDIKVEATGSIELVAGGSSVVIGSAGVYIKGTMVYINSGSGPPVPAVSKSPGAPEAPEDVTAAERTDPGKDTTYSGGGNVGPAPAPPDLPGKEIPGVDFKKETFIEFQLLDADDKPVSGEDYKVELPDGTIKTGKTDGEGVARFEPVQGGGGGYIQFPNREDPEWIFVRVEQPGKKPGSDPGKGGSGDGKGGGGTGGGGGKNPPPLPPKPPQKPLPPIPGGGPPPVPPKPPGKLPPPIPPKPPGLGT